MEMENKSSKSPLIFNSFILKLVAIITMTIDHVGFMMQSYYVQPELGEIFRYIGRFALPLYCFMIVEGVIHTKNFKKYALRLGVCALAISITMIAVEYLPIFQGETLRDLGNIFIDLLLGATAVFCLRNKRIWVKCLAILPLAFGVASMLVTNNECIACTGKDIWWVPFFLRSQYGYYGILMIILFYVGYLVSDVLLSNFGKGVYDNTITERVIKNVVSIVVLVIVNVIYYITVTNIFTNLGGMLEIQMFSIAASVFILFYNGKRGYNAKWFQYSCYAYYAVQAIAIFGIFMLLFG